MNMDKFFRPLAGVTLVALFFWGDSLSVPCWAQEKEQDSNASKLTSIAADEFKLIENPIAIMGFKSRGKEVAGVGEKVADLMFATMVVDPSLLLVDREDLDKVLEEAELNLSALVKPQEAITIGQLTGAKLLVTGSVFKVDDFTYVVAKIIGTETSRVVGASAKGGSGDSLDEIVKRAGEKIIASIKKNSDSLVAERVDQEKRISQLKEILKDKQLPKVFVSIKEQHVGQSSLDPAAETELMLIMKKCGFDVIDAEQGSEQQADLLLKGEGVSEFATRTGNLISVRARLELKVVDRKSGEVIAVDRQTRMAVGLAEQIAGKKALENCASDIAVRVLPKLIKKVK